MGQTQSSPTDEMAQKMKEVIKTDSKYQDQLLRRMETINGFKGQDRIDATTELANQVIREFTTGKFANVSKEWIDKYKQGKTDEEYQSGMRLAFDALINLLLSDLKSVNEEQLVKEIGNMWDDVGFA